MTTQALDVLQGITATSNREYEKIAESHRKRRTSGKQLAMSRLQKSKRSLELAKIIAEAERTGSRSAIARLHEAVSSGDFPLLFANISQASVMGHYAELPQQWPALAQRTTVPDFRPARLVRWDTGLNQLPDYNGGATRHVRALPRIPELTEYPTFNLTTEGSDYFVNKYGARFPFSWEAFLNDELGVLRALPMEMARWARDTEDVLTTGVLATADGPNPDFFNTEEDFGPQVPAGNYISVPCGGVCDPETGERSPTGHMLNPPLTLDNLEKAIQMIGMRQVGHRMVRVQNFALVVPPSLALTAREIAQATTYMRVTTDAQGNEVRMNVASPIAGRFTVVESEWLPLIDQSENAATTWYLVPAGGATDRGPAIVTAFLRGHESPEVRVMGDTGRSIGGGEISAFEGSFSHDDIQYRVRAILGAAGIDNSAVAVSDGTGCECVPDEVTLLGGNGGTPFRADQGTFGPQVRSQAQLQVDADMRAQLEAAKKANAELEMQLDAERKKSALAQAQTGTQATQTPVKPDTKSTKDSKDTKK